MSCPKCGLPEELCVCHEMTKEGQKIRVYSDKRRYGKPVTIIEGFDGVDVPKIAKDLKRKLACGGTSRDSSIELQGNHTHRVRDVLIELGFSEEMVDVV